MTPRFVPVFASLLLTASACTQSLGIWQPTHAGINVYQAGGSKRLRTIHYTHALQLAIAASGELFNWRWTGPTNPSKSIRPVARVLTVRSTAFMMQML